MHRPVRLITAVVACMLCALACTACSSRATDTQTTQVTPTRTVEHRPITPSRLGTPDSPAILATITPFAPKTIPGHDDWQIITSHVSRAWRITWRVPLDWETTSSRRAESGDQRVRSVGSFTTLTASDVTLSAYLKELADGEPIHSFVSPNGYTFYVIERRVSVAPTDPDAASAYYHTAIVNIGGHIAKLEITYATADRFRFEDLANAIIATAEVTPA